MGRVIRIFIEKHTAIFCLSVLVVAMGVYSYIVLPRESFPEIKQPFIFVNTSYSGASASDIETLVTKVIESELEGLNGLEEIESTSVQHASSIFLTFNSSVSVEEALRRTKDRVDSAKRDLPNDANDPFVQEFDVSDWPVFTVALTHPSGVEVLETIAEDLKDELRKINGVLEANVEGNIQKELAIELDPYRMATYGISVNDVENAIRQEHKTIPGGTLLSQEKNYSLAVTGELTEELAFQDLMVSGSGGGQVPLASVAEVKLKEARNVTLSRLNGLPSIRVSLKKRIGTNLLELSEQAHTKIDEIKPMLPANTEILVSYDQSTFVKEMLADLENNMASGFILVLLVTIFFLGFRNALFVSLAIPLSMLLSFFVLQSMGITLNMIVLFSLILALGMLVDNGIVIVENIYRHASMGKSQVQAAIDGTSEVIGPVSASTLTTLLAFFPIIFMPGVMGDFMKFLPITVIVVLSSSLFVAVCINPVFCSQYLRVTEKQKRKMEQGSDFFTTFQRWYIKLLKKATKHAVKTILLVTAIVFAGFVVYRK